MNFPLFCKYYILIFGTSKYHQIEKEIREKRINWIISKTSVSNLRHNLMWFDAKRVAICAKTNDESMHISSWFDANCKSFSCNFALLFVVNFVTCWVIMNCRLLKNDGYLERGRVSFQIRKSTEGYCKNIW